MRKDMLIHNGETVLFIGDSITHWYSYWATDGADLGIGYVSMVARALTGSYGRRGQSFRFLNRGWSGNRVADLTARWTKDCLELRPDWVSLFIGINDCLGPQPTAPAVFAAHYEKLLAQTREQGARLIVLAPFLIATEAEGDFQRRKPLDTLLPVIERLATQYAEVFIPLEPLFQQVAAVVDRRLLSKDGVHPTLAGHGLIADAWLRAVGAVEL